jgi:twinkle protein
VVKHKITQEKIFMPHAQKEMSCLVWNYFRNEQIVNKKYRSGDKGFKMESGAELIFYNLDHMNGEVIITEGEMDCMSFDEAGFQSVISVPNGATLGNNNLQYLDNCWEYFDNVEKVYLALDNDDAGQKLMHELARRIGKERCMIVKYPDDCKDANEVIIKHGTEVLKNCIATAEGFPLEGVITVDDIEDDIHRLYREGVDKGQEAGMGDFDELCSFRTSMLYTFTGIPSHGKSTFVNNLEIKLSVEDGWKWGIFSPEHYPLEYMVYKYVEILTGKPFFHPTARIPIPELIQALQFIKKHFFFIRPKNEMFTLDKIMEAGRQLVVKHGINGFTIDPWNTIQHDYGRFSETQYIERALNQLTIFKQEQDLAVFLVAHPTKLAKMREGEGQGMYEIPTLYDIAGSSNFFNKTDVGITIYRNFNALTSEVYVQKMKYKNMGTIGWTKFVFNSMNNRFDADGFNGIPESYLKTNEQIEILLDEKDELPF